MEYILAAVVLLLIIVTVKYVSYRRQIKDICHQLAFIVKERSNYRLRTEINEKEIAELVSMLNQMNDAYAEKRACDEAERGAVEGHDGKSGARHPHAAYVAERIFPAADAGRKIMRSNRNMQKL